MQPDRPDFPSLQDVEKANREQLGRWFTFLVAGTNPSPEQKKIIKRIEERFEQLGGMTPELEKKIGY